MFVNFINTPYITETWAVWFPVFYIIHELKNEQRLSPNPLIHVSIKRTTISNLKSLNTMKTTTYSTENPSHGFGQAQKGSGAKPVNGCKSRPLDIWIFNGNTFFVLFINTKIVCSLLDLYFVLSLFYTTVALVLFILKGTFNKTIVIS